MKQESEIDIRNSVNTFPLQLNVNGENLKAKIDFIDSLYDTLRDHFNLTGTKAACLEGECGSCSVIINGEVVTSCLVMAAQCHKKKVTTIEGLVNDRIGSTLQNSFVQCGAIQCGYCTPGLIITARQLLKKNPTPSRENIINALEGNLCRCTGYTKIIDAVFHASQELS